MFLPFTYKCDEYQRCVRDDVINADNIDSVMSLGECINDVSKCDLFNPYPSK